MFRKVSFFTVLALALLYSSTAVSQQVDLPEGVDIPENTATMPDAEASGSGGMADSDTNNADNSNVADNNMNDKILDDDTCNLDGVEFVNTSNNGLEFTKKDHEERIRILKERYYEAKKMMDYTGLSGNDRDAIKKAIESLEKQIRAAEADYDAFLKNNGQGNNTLSTLRSHRDLIDDLKRELNLAQIRESVSCTHGNINSEICKIAKEKLEAAKKALADAEAACRAAEANATRKNLHIKSGDDKTGSNFYVVLVDDTQNDENRKFDYSKLKYETVNLQTCPQNTDITIRLKEKAAIDGTPFFSSLYKSFLKKSVYDLKPLNSGVNLHDAEFNKSSVKAHYCNYDYDVLPANRYYDPKSRKMVAAAKPHLIFGLSPRFMIEDQVKVEDDCPVPHTPAKNNLDISLVCNPTAVVGGVNCICKPNTLNYSPSQFNRDKTANKVDSFILKYETKAPKPATPTPKM